PAAQHLANRRTLEPIDCRGMQHLAVFAKDIQRLRVNVAAEGSFLALSERTGPMRLESFGLVVAGKASFARCGVTPLAENACALATRLRTQSSYFLFERGWRL